MTSAESRDGSPLTTLSSGIVRAQVPPRPPTTLIKLMQAIPPAAVVGRGCPEPHGSQFKEAHRCATLPGLSLLVFLFFCFLFFVFRRTRGLEREAQGARWGSWDAHRQTLRQPVCKGMLVPLPSPSTSLDFYYIAHLI